MRITPLHAWIAGKISVPEVDFNPQNITGWQLIRLRQVIQYVKMNSPYYRAIFSGTEPLNSLSDFSCYPFTTAEDLIENTAAFVCVSQEEVHRIVTLPTSGTTNDPKRIFFSLADQDLTVDFFKVGMSTLARSGDKVLILLPGERPGSVGDLLFTALTKLGSIPIKYGPVDEEEKVLRLIKEEEINVLVGAPVHLYRLACLDEEKMILPPGWIRSVLVSTDVLPDIVSFRLKEIWGCEVYDHYGLTESGLGGGVECDAHNGYHMREADLYVEIIDPDSGELLLDGEEGEVVITTLTREAMPLIRYRTGDISRLLPGNCICGSFIKRLAPIKNRLKCGVRIYNGYLRQVQLDEVLFGVNGIRDFKAFVEKDITDKDILRIQLRVVTGSDYNVATSALAAVSRIPLILEAVKKDSLDMAFEIMNAPETGEGTVFTKRRIIDLRQNMGAVSQASR